MSRPSKRTWSGGLYERLKARGFDAYSAKMASRHVRADIFPFLRTLTAELDCSIDDMVEAKAAIEWVEKIMGVKA